MLGRVENNEDGRESPPSDYTTHWLVSVEGDGQQGNSDEEEISERYLGRILANKEDDSSSNSSHAKKVGLTTRKENGSTKSSSSKGGSNKSPSVAAKAKDTSKAAAKVPAKKTTNAPSKYGTRASRRQRGDDSELFVGDNIEKMVPKKKPRVVAPKVGPDETVIEVKMLTGTLYLFRGAKPRAEFIRTV